MQICEIAIRINELNAKLKELQDNFNNTIKEKNELTQLWRSLCSHPSEYLEVCNKFHHDDHGEIKKTNPKDYKYICSACGQENINNA